MRRPRSKRRRNWDEIRRKQAIALVRQGWKQIEVAKMLGVTKGVISQWVSIYQSKGLRGLRSANRLGGPRKLGQEQLTQIPELLWHGAEAYGFRGNMWTCRRIAVVVEREFGVRYHPHHVAKLLKELEWTPHTPITRATQRDENAIDLWRNQTWLELKKSESREKKPIFAG